MQCGAECAAPLRPAVLDSLVDRTAGEFLADAVRVDAPDLHVVDAARDAVLACGVAADADASRGVDRAHRHGDLVDRCTVDVELHCGGSIAPKTERYPPAGGNEGGASEDPVM